MTDLAVLGSLILLVFGTLLAYIQELNDRQHATMASFRRTLHRAYEGNGALIHGVFIENRRVIALDAGFKKGQMKQNMVSSDVFWAVPGNFAPAGNTATRKNGNTEETYYRQYHPDEIADKYAYYQVNEEESEDLMETHPLGNSGAIAYESPVADYTYYSDLTFNETVTSGKGTTVEGVVTLSPGTSTSTLSETVTTNLTRADGSRVTHFDQGIKRSERGRGYSYGPGGGGSVTNTADY